MMKNQMLSHKLFQALVFAAMAVPLLLDGFGPASASVAQAGSTVAKHVAPSEVNAQPLLADITTFASGIANNLTLSNDGTILSADDNSSGQIDELTLRHRRKPRRTLTLSSDTTTLSSADDLTVQVAGRIKGPHRRRKL